MVTLLVTVLDLGFESGFLFKWLRAYVIAWPVAAITAFCIMPPARRVTEWTVTLLDGRRSRCTPGRVLCNGAAESVLHPGRGCLSGALQHREGVGAMLSHCSNGPPSNFYASSKMSATSVLR